MTHDTQTTQAEVTSIHRRCLACCIAVVDIRGEYSDRPDHYLTARIDVYDTDSIPTKYEPYIFTLIIDDIVVDHDTYRYLSYAVEKWNRLADIFGYPYVDYDGYTLHVANSSDSPTPAA